LFTGDDILESFFLLVLLFTVDDFLASIFWPTIPLSPKFFPMSSFYYCRCFLMSTIYGRLFLVSAVYLNVFRPVLFIVDFFWQLLLTFFCRVMLVNVFPAGIVYRLVYFFFC